MPAPTTLVPVPPTLDDVARSRIRAWIRSSGVTQSELAARIGKNQAWLSRYLSGKFDADLATLDKITRAFGQPFSALVDVPTDPMEADLLASFRALRLSDRTIVVELLASWSTPRRPGRGRTRE